MSAIILLIDYINFRGYKTYQAIMKLYLIGTILYNLNFPNQMRWEKDFNDCKEMEAEIFKTR